MDLSLEKYSQYLEDYNVEEWILLESICYSKSIFINNLKEYIHFSIFTNIEKYKIQQYKVVLRISIGQEKDKSSEICLNEQTRLYTSKLTKKQINTYIDATLSKIFSTSKYPEYFTLCVLNETLPSKIKWKYLFNTYETVLGATVGINDTHNNRIFGIYIDKKMRPIFVLHDKNPILVEEKNLALLEVAGNAKPDITLLDAISIIEYIIFRMVKSLKVKYTKAQNDDDRLYIKNLIAAIKTIYK